MSDRHFDCNSGKVFDRSCVVPEEVHAADAVVLVDVEIHFADHIVNGDVVGQLIRDIEWCSQSYGGELSSVARNRPTSRDRAPGRYSSWPGPIVTLLFLKIRHRVGDAEVGAAASYGCAKAVVGVVHRRGHKWAADASVGVSYVIQLALQAGPEEEDAPPSTTGPPRCRRIVPAFFAISCWVLYRINCERQRHRHRGQTRTRCREIRSVPQS